MISKLKYILTCIFQTIQIFPDFMGDKLDANSDICIMCRIDNKSNFTL